MASSLAPDSVNLVRQIDALHALTIVRIERGMSSRSLCELANLSSNSIAEWRRGRRAPQLSNFIRLAQTLGYEVVLVDGKDAATDFRDLTACIDRIDVERRAKKVGLYEMELQAGVSVRTYYSWWNEDRIPTIANLVALAETFGFSVIMRRVPVGTDA
ncbi:helix-turn-helix transcriptional regulator [Aureimonas sp. AU40]|uniref:helix-turn-helix transcriptional regulator n=1 Tax=Aureimonas sp. AU40 TaxID=1637747 RepID=UPI000785A984|nr:helix-turn-helix transcriptional regulator [Aureimonas sp. AU40]